MTVTTGNYELIKIAQDGFVATVTIDRPDALNALNKQIIAELQDWTRSVWYDDTIRVIIITGAGKAFISGADIGELVELGAITGARKSTVGQHLMKSLENIPKVVIAAINGFAFGGGLELALACDIRVASEKARMGLPEVKLGIIPGYGGTQRLARLIGAGRAKQMIFTGEFYTADQCKEFGLLQEVWAPDEFMAKTKELAELIASRGPLAVAAAKECINRGLDMPLSNGNDFEKITFGNISATVDMHEGLTAFLEKRDPNFKGE
ncbi:MAG: enoyl-CoA hydratase/isomerase family protein [candidate division Zixibacteria bacterium]|nr:enoyl-CoA hydratase/isomerase family protein [candidate division Zixibacteria bacterium]